MKCRKILLIDLGVPYGGVATYLVNLANILRGRVELFAICANARLAASLEDAGVRLISHGGLKDRGKLANIVIAALLISWTRLHHGISTVWINGCSEIVLLPVAKMLGAKAVATRHLSMESQPKDWHLHPRRNVAQWLYETFAFTADRIFCVSSRVFQDIVKIVDAQKVGIIPNWVPEIPDPVIHIESGKMHLLFVGRLERYKGASLILEAMRGLDGVSLTIVGDGPYKDELQKMAEGLDVQFAGFQPDPRKFYTETDIFINPSVGPEGLPLVSLEAMSFGLPCILSNLDVHAEITGNGESAALFKVGDTVDLREKISRFAAEHDLRLNYGLRARVAIAARHSPEAARSAYLTELESLGKAA